MSTVAPPHAEASPSRHVPALTGFRALAAAMVLVGHLEYERGGATPWLLRYGWTGVNLFFALSGFLFTLLYFDRFAAGAVSLRDYFVKRAARVLPLTWALVLLSFALTASRSLGDLVAHLTLTHAYFEPWRFTLNAPMWTLCVEESFYLVVPPLFVALAAVERARPHATTVARVLAVTACLALLTESGIAAAGQLQDLKHAATDTWDNGIWVMTLPGRFSDFACGIVAGVAALRASSSRWLRTPLGATSLVALGCAVWAWSARWVESHGGPGLAGGFAGYQVVIRLFSLGGALAIAGLYGRSWLTPMFASRPLVYAGRISFALYLAQDAALGAHTLSEHLSRVVRARVHHEALAVIVLYVLVSVVAAALHHGVEDPAQRWLRRRFVRSE